MHQIVKLLDIRTECNIGYPRRQFLGIRHFPDIRSDSEKISSKQKKKKKAYREKDCNFAIMYKIL